MELEPLALNPGNPCPILDSLLRDLLAEGQMHSEGSFTLNFERARQKLSAFLLEHAQDTWLKLVQAGVALGATRLNFSESRTEIVGTCPEFRGAEILGHLLQKSDGPRGLRHLAIALNTALLTHPPGLKVSCWDGCQGRMLYFRGQSLEEAAWHPPAGSPPLLCLDWLRPAESGWARARRLLQQRLLGSPAANLKFLQQRAGWSPVPLYYDSKPLPPPPIGPQDHVHQRSGFEAQILGAWMLPGQGLRLGSMEGRALLAYGSQPSIGEVENRILWLQDGVVVGTQKVPGPFYGEFRWLVVDGSQCPADLSGLHIVQDKSCSHLYEEILRECPRSLRVSPPPVDWIEISGLPTSQVRH